MDRRADPRRPEGHDEWYLAVTVDLPASAEAGEIVARVEGLRRR